MAGFVRQQVPKLGYSRVFETALDSAGGDQEAVLTLLHVYLSLPKIVHDVYGGFGTVGDQWQRYTGL